MTKMRACAAKLDGGPEAALLLQSIATNSAAWKQMDPTTLAATCKQALAIPNPACP
jgi:hypothetical protein